MRSLRDLHPTLFLSYDMAERPKYGAYDIPGRPTDTDFDELWEYIRACTWPDESGHIWEALSPHPFRYEVGLKPLAHQTAQSA